MFNVWMVWRRDGTGQDRKEWEKGRSDNKGNQFSGYYTVVLPLLAFDCDMLLANRNVEVLGEQMQHPEEACYLHVASVHHVKSSNATEVSFLSVLGKRTRLNRLHT